MAAGGHTTTDIILEAESRQGQTKAAGLWCQAGAASVKRGPIINMKKEYSGADTLEEWEVRALTAQTLQLKSTSSAMQ